MTKRHRTSKRPARRTSLAVAGQMATMTIKPLDKDECSGPSREQWDEWNNEHGEVLRLACATLAKNKDELAALARSLSESSGAITRLAKLMQQSAKFFTD